MRSINKIIAVLLVMVMTLSILPVSAFTASAATTSDPAPSVSAVIKRLGGADRYETSTKIAQEGWTSADTVVLASADSYADALAGAPLARAKDAPIMLVSGKSVNAKVMAQIKALGAKTVYLLGGTAAISAEIEAELTKAGYTVIRLWDSTRYGTAVAVAKELVKINGNPSEVFIASGVNYPDALSASSIAGIKGVPILYAPANGVLDNATIAFLKSVKPGKAYILGGTAAIDNAVVGKLTDAGVASTERLGGNDRYDTSLIITKKFDSVFTSKDISIATGKNYPDALAGGAFSAKKVIPVLLTDNASVNSDLKAYIAAKDPAVAYVFGGESVVSDAIVKAYLPVPAPTTTTTTAAPSTPATPAPVPSITRYKVTFEANGDNVENMPAEQRVKKNQCATEPAEPTREGYTFGGWYTEAECVNEFDFATKITKKITLYAKWDEEIEKVDLSEEELDEILRELYESAERKVDEADTYSEDSKSMDINDDSSPIIKVTVSYILNNDAGDVIIKEYSGKEYFQDTAGAIGLPVDIEVVGDTIKKATITFTYDKDKLGNINPKDLGIAYYDETTGESVLVENVIVDEDACTITVETDHFSSWTVVDTSEWVKAWETQLPRIRNSSSGSNAEVFFNVVLTLDSSGSMAGSNNTLSKAAANELVKYLKENDVLSVVSFGSSASLVMDATYVGKTTTEEISQKINSINTGGGTDFCEGLSLSSKAITDSMYVRILNPWYDDRSTTPNYETKNIVIFLSDGHDSNSAKEIESAISAMNSSKVTVITVGLGSGASKTTLSKIATGTGGNYYFAKSANDLSTLYNEIAGLYIGSDTDTDGDGLPDLAETIGMRTTVGKIYKTDPNNADTDGDGFSDGEEMGTYFSETNKFKVVSNPNIKTVFHDYSKPTGLDVSVKPVIDVEVEDVKDIDCSKFNILVDLDYTDYEIITKTTISITGDKTVTETEHIYNKKPDASFILIECDDECMPNDLYVPNEASNTSAEWNCQCSKASKGDDCGAIHSVKIKAMDSAAEKDNCEFIAVSPIYSISEAKGSAKMEYAKRRFERCEEMYKVMPDYTPSNYPSDQSPVDFADDFREALEKKATAINDAQEKYVDPAREGLKKSLSVELTSLSVLDKTMKEALEAEVLDYIINVLGKEALKKDYSNIFKGDDWTFDMTSPFEMISFENSVIKEVCELCSDLDYLEGEFSYNGNLYEVESAGYDVTGAVFGTLSVTNKATGKEYLFTLSGEYRESLTIFMGVMNNLYASVEQTVRDAVSVWKIPGYVGGYLDLCDFDDFLRNEIDYTKEMTEFFKANSFGSEKYKKLVEFSTAKTIILEFMDNLGLVQTAIDAAREMLNGKSLDDVTQDTGADMVLDQVEEIEDAMNDSVREYFRNAIFGE